MHKCLARIGSWEKSAAGLKTSVGKLETKLETVIEERFKHFEKHLEKMESSLTAKLDKIDEDIRGNGKNGINIRLDPLENTKKPVSRYFWIVVAAKEARDQFKEVLRSDKHTPEFHRRRDKLWVKRARQMLGQLAE